MSDDGFGYMKCDLCSGKATPKKWVMHKGQIIGVCDECLTKLCVKKEAESR